MTSKHSEESHQQAHSSPSQSQLTEVSHDDDIFSPLTNTGGGEQEDDSFAQDREEATNSSAHDGDDDEEEGEVEVETGSAAPTAAAASPSSESLGHNMGPILRVGGAIERYILEKFREADAQGKPPPAYVIKMVTGLAHEDEIYQANPRSLNSDFASIQSTGSLTITLPPICSTAAIQAKSSATFVHDATQSTPRARAGHIAKFATTFPFVTAANNLAKYASEHCSSAHDTHTSWQPSSRARRPLCTQGNCPILITEA